MRLPDSVGIAALLASAASATAIGIDGVLPTLPGIEQTFGSTRTEVQITLSLFMIGVAAGQLIYGPLSDRLGRKPVIIGGLLLNVLATAGCATSQSIEILIACRFVHGLAASSGFIVARAVVRDRYERASAARVLSIMLFFYGFAPLLAPVIAAHLTVEFGWRAVFVFIGTYSATIALTFGLVFRESLQTPDTRALRLAPMYRSFRLVSRSRVFWTYSTCAAAAYGVLFSFLSSSAHVIITHFGEPATAYGYMFGGCMLGTMTGTLANARLITRVRTDRLMQWGGWMISFFALILAALAWANIEHWLAVIVPMAFCMFAFSLIFPQAIAGAMQPFPDNAGAASSLTGLVQQLTGAGTAIIVGALTIYWPQIALSHGVLFWSLFALAIIHFIIRPRRETRRPVSRIG